MWQLNGVPVCTAAYNQEDVVTTLDGRGGAIITWHDGRTATITQADVYAQRVDSLGAPLWIADGKGVCTIDSGQGWPCITATDTGKTVISWFDYRSGQYDIYAQTLDGAGNLQWPADGLPVCTATGVQFNDIYNRQNQIITADNAGGVILVWHDTRSGVDVDIYAQRLRAVTGVEEEQVQGSQFIVHSRLYQNQPNPFAQATKIRYQIADDYTPPTPSQEGIMRNAECGKQSSVSLKIYNITGQLVKTLVNKDRKMGRYEVRWDGTDESGKRVADGVYFYRLTAGDFTAIKKMVLLR
ncbi:MAG: FlgD immunoglobulin-like domain containing protein [Candidatus Edwardsbacteria bacterium]